MKLAKPLFPVCLAALLAAPAFADTSSSIAITPRAGTLGIGADLSVPLAEHFNARVGYGHWSRSREYTESDVKYDGKLTLNGALIVADWFPFGGNFRLSGGIAHNMSKMVINAKPAGTVTFGNNTYSSSDVSVQGKINYEKTAPYIGLGYGNASARSKLGFFFEYGLIRQRTKVTLDGTCNAGSPACDNFQSDLALERDDLQDKARDFKWYPVLQLGMSIRF